MKPPSQRLSLSAFLMLICSFILLASMPGCTNAQVENYQQLRAETNAAIVEAKAQLAVVQPDIDALDAQVEAAEEGPDRKAAIKARDTLQALVDEANAVIPVLEEDVKQLTAAIDAGLAGNTAEAVRIGGRFIAAKAPPPWNIYILGGTTLLGALLTYRQKRIADDERKRKESADRQAERKTQEAQATRNAAESVINAIEREKDNTGTVEFGDDVAKVSLRSRMSSEARDLVAQTRRANPQPPRDTATKNAA